VLDRLDFRSIHLPCLGVHIALKFRLGIAPGIWVYIVFMLRRRACGLLRGLDELLPLALVRCGQRWG